MPPRYAPASPLPPYAYVPGHDLPHPVTDPRGHSYAARALAAAPASPPQWLHALDLFNAGYAWEAHEVWEGFWHALGRTTREARFVQGLIHLAAAVVKIREGKPAGVSRHTRRARELLASFRAAPGSGTRPGLSDGHDEAPGHPPFALGLAPDSLAAVVAELEAYTPECWHTSRAAVVRVVASELRLAVPVGDTIDTPTE